jgi:CubicO group peptidase (beta-lactamase class C family)
MDSQNPNRWERITHLLQGYLVQHYYPGFLSCVYQRGHVIYEDCLGLMDIERGKPMRPDTIFRIYSMSKPVTCAAMLMLFEEGKFALDDPVTAYIPAFKAVKVYAGQDENGFKLVDAERPITIRQLLTHTSGLGYGLDEGPVEELYRQAGRPDREKSSWAAVGVPAGYRLELQHLAPCDWLPDQPPFRDAV